MRQISVRIGAYFEFAELLVKFETSTPHLRKLEGRIVSVRDTDALDHIAVF